MNASIRWRLSLMMFLEYAVWGVWAPILVLHLVKLDAFTGPAAFTRVNHIYMTMAIASIIAPFVAGQIADRYFATQRFLALSHLAGGVLLLVVARLTGYGSIFFGMLAYSIIYAPTLALTNSICFHHLPDGEKDFSRIRLWGTIGWVVIAWVFSLWIGLADGLLGEIAPAVETALVHWRQSLVHKPDVVDCLYASAALSFLLGLFCLALPHTPPPEKPENPYAFLGALRLMKDRSFAVMVIIAFFVATELQFYFVLSPAFFNAGGGPFGAPQMTEFFVQDQSIPPDEAGPTALHLIEIGDKNGDAKLNRDELASLAGDYPAARTFLDAQNKRIQARGGLALDNAYVAPVMTFGQICETIVLAFLPLVLTHLGFRLTIALGILAWSVRYFVFALGEPTALVLASQTLHGFGYGFFFVAIYIYGDAIAPKDIKASVQSLLVFVTIGVGMLVSSLVAGPIADALQQDYHKIFLVPAILCLVCCGAFYAGFRPKAAVNAPPSSQK